MDLGKKESQIAILTEAGEAVEKRIRTERERLTQYFRDRPPAKILIEASTRIKTAPRCAAGERVPACDKSESRRVREKAAASQGHSRTARRPPSTTGPRPRPALRVDVFCRVDASPDEKGRAPP